MRLVVKKKTALQKLGFYRVTVDEETLEVKDIGEAKTEDTVFHAKPFDLDFSYQVPAGQKVEGEGASRWRRFLVDKGTPYIVGWENAWQMENGKKVPLDFELHYMTDGIVVDPNITGALVFFLIEKLGETRKGKRSRGKGSSSSANTRKRKVSSGKATRDRGAAARAKSRGKKAGSRK